MERIPYPQQHLLRFLFCSLFLSVVIHSQAIAVDLPAGWRQQYDNRKKAQVFKPSGTTAHILIKYYPKEPIGSVGISQWLRVKLSKDTAPKGEWQGEADVVRDSANAAHGTRGFQLADGSIRVLEAFAVTLDHKFARLAIMLRDKEGGSKELLEQAAQILGGIFKTEKLDAEKEGRKTIIEAAPPIIENMKLGGAIKPGRYVGAKTWDLKVKRQFEVILYDTGEYEFIKGYNKSGSYVYSQALGKLDMVEDFYNSSSYSNENFCVYGFHEKIGTEMIYAQEGNNRYRLRWAGPVDRLSPWQRKQVNQMEIPAKQGYQYITKHGEGVRNDQIETILYTYQGETQKALYLLMKDGRVRYGLPVAPSMLDAAKSRSREPNSWGWWKYENNHYVFAWDIERKNYKAPGGRQVYSQPVPSGMRLAGDWGASSSFVSLDYSEALFWGVRFDKSGRFQRYRRSSRQAGGPMALAGGPLVMAYKEDEFSAVTVTGENVGGGAVSRRKLGSHRIGSYEFDGYTLILKYDNGVVKYLPTFRTGNQFSGIWFEGEYLYKKN
jgi:hypothetical protein